MGKEKEWFQAIRGGQVQYIINLLNALKDKQPGKLKNLVKKLHSVDGTQSTALHLSCQYDRCELVAILLQNGASPNLADESGCTALHMAAWNGNEKICTCIMENSVLPVDVNTKNLAGDTPLHLASQHGHEKVVETLLALGADPLMTNSAGLTALSLACQFGRATVVSALVLRVPREAKIVMEYESSNRSPLHTASHNGHAAVVEILLKNGFSVNAKTKDGSSCLHEAVVWNRVPVVDILLKYNIDTEAKNSEDKTALDLLARNNQEFGIKMRKMIQNHKQKEVENEDDVVDGSCISSMSKKKPSIKQKSKGKSSAANDELEEEDKELTAILEIGTVLSQSSEDTEHSDKRKTRATTPELMRRLSSKYRAQFEKICSNDHEDEDLMALEGAESDEDETSAEADDVFK